MPKRRKKPALATPPQITVAIYSLTTRGKRARSHIKEELLQIITAARAQLADYQKGLENHRRHKKRNPNWPSSIRAAAWFAANRRDRIDEPRNVATTQQEALQQQEDHEWGSLQEYEDWIRSTTSTPAARPASQQPQTQAERDYLANLAVSREIGKERGEQGWDDDD
jgi:hypothetical protein